MSPVWVKSSPGKWNLREKVPRDLNRVSLGVFKKHHGDPRDWSEEAKRLDSGGGFCPDGGRTMMELLPLCFWKLQGTQATAQSGLRGP